MSWFGKDVPLPSHAEPEPARVNTNIDKELYGADMPASIEMHPPEIALRETFRAHVDEVSDVLGLSHPQRIARHRAHVALVREAGLGQNIELAGMLYDEVTKAEVAAAHSAGDDDDLEATVRADTEASRKALRDLYGRERADAILTRLQSFVSKHPKLKALVNTRGIGSKPAVVLALADHVRKIGGRI